MLIFEVSTRRIRNKDKTESLVSVLVSDKHKQNTFLSSHFGLNYQPDHTLSTVKDTTHLPLKHSMSDNTLQLSHLGKTYTYKKPDTT